MNDLRNVALLAALGIAAGCGEDAKTGQLTGGVAAAAEPTPIPAPNDDFTQQASYAVGYDFGRSLHSQEAKLEPQRAAKGLSDGLTGAEPELGERQIAQVLSRFGAEMAKKTGLRFLAENRQQQGVQVTGSGLQYEIIEKGTGRSPTAKDTVRVHYQGSLLSGAIFDSSYASGKPIEFEVQGVIPGWTEALQLMHVGAKWRLFIPSQLAYGEEGTPGGPIGPNEVLIFDVELLAIVQ